MRKQRRDMTPDELEAFEEDVLQDSDQRAPESGPASEQGMGREPDRNKDGLPDTPAKWRVPS